MASPSHLSPSHGLIFLSPPPAADLPGCYTSLVNSQAVSRPTTHQLARIESMESTFIVCLILFSVLVWVGGQIAQSPNIKIKPEYGAKKKR